MADTSGVMSWIVLQLADDLVQTAPLIELIQTTHDPLYSRLFQS